MTRRWSRGIQIGVSSINKGRVLCLGRIVTICNLKGVS